MLNAENEDKKPGLKWAGPEILKWVGNVIKDTVDTNIANGQDLVDIVKAPATDSNPITDIGNKLGAYFDVSRNRFNQDDKVREELLDTFTNEGIDAYKNKRQQYYGNQPLVVDTDKDYHADLFNSRYNVNLINNADTSRYVQNQATNGQLELRVLDDDSLRTAYDTAWNTRNMGRDKLAGVTNNTRYVLYDTNTGKYYRYFDEGDVTYNNAIRNIDTYKALYEAQTANLERGQAYYEGLLAKTSGNVKANVYSEYAKFYEDNVYAINGTSQKLNELQSTYVPDEAFRNNLNAQIDKYDAVKAEYDKYAHAIADYDNPYQKNSILDVLKDAVHYAGKDNWFELMEDTLGEYWGFRTGPYSKDLTMKPGQRALTVLQNRLVDFGETMDFLPDMVKSLILADTKGMSKKQAWDSLWGGAGTGGYYKWDYNTGNIATDIVLETISDPGTWLTLGTSAAAKAVVAPCRVEAIKISKELGTDLTEESLNKIAKIAANAATTNTKVSIQEAVRDAYIRAFAKQDTHTLLAKLGNEFTNFTEADRLGKLIIDGGYISGGAKEADIVTLLRKTNLPEDEIRRVLGVCNTNYAKAIAACTDASYRITKDAAFKVASTVRTLNKIDDVYATVIRDLTLTTPLAIGRGVKTAFKVIRDNTDIPERVQMYLINKFGKNAPVDETPLATETFLMDCNKALDSTRSYIMTLAQDNAELLKSLRESKDTFNYTVYNGMVSNLLTCFGTEVDALIKRYADVGKTLTTLECYHMFDDVAKKYTNSTMSFAELFSFLSSTSEFAEYISPANIAMWNKLVYTRNLYIKGDNILAASGKVNSIVEGFKRLNETIDMFEKQGATTGVIDSYNSGYALVKDALSEVPAGKDRNEILENLAFLDDTLDTIKDYAATNNVDTYNKVVLAKRNFHSAVAKASDSFITNADSSFKQAQVAFYKREFEPDKIDFKQRNADTTLNIVQDLFKKHDVDLSKEEIERVVIKDLSKPLDNLNANYVVIDASKTAKRLALLGNPKLQDMASELTNTVTPLGKFMNNLAKFDTTNTLIKNTLSSLYTYNVELLFQTRLNNIHLPANMYAAITDALAGDMTTYINRIVEDADLSDLAVRDYVTAEAMRVIQEHAENYLHGITPPKCNMQMMYNVVNGEAVNFNTVNALTNVEHLNDALSSDLLSGVWNNAQVAGARDVLFSIVGTGTEADPVQVCFKDLKTNTTKVFKLDVAGDALSVSEDTILKMHNLNYMEYRNGVLEANKEYVEGVTRLYKDKQKMYQALIAFMNTVRANAGGESIRYVGFNTGAMYTGQATVLKNILRKYGDMPKGDIVDLADMVRREKFPNTYMDDQVLSALRYEVRAHVDRIASVAPSIPVPIGFCTAPDSMSKCAYDLVMEEFKRLIENPGYTPRSFNKDIAITYLDNADVPNILNRYDDVLKSKLSVYHSLGTYKPSVQQVINFNALKEVFQSHTGYPLNIMYEMRDSSNNLLTHSNIRYVYRRDELKRWFKDSVLEGISAEDVVLNYERYKKLMSYETRMKDVGGASSLSHSRLVDAINMIVANSDKAVYKTQAYRIFRDLDMNKLNNTQLLAVAAMLKSYTNVAAEAIEDAETLEFQVAANIYETMQAGVLRVDVQDLTKYNYFMNTYNTLLEAERLCSTAKLYTDNLDSLDTYFKSLDVKFGTTHIGMERAYLQEIGKGTYAAHKNLADLRDRLAGICKDMNKYVFADAPIPKQVMKRYKSVKATLAESMDSLKHEADRVGTDAFKYLSTLTPAELKQHLISNCSGTIVAQLSPSILETQPEFYYNFIKKLQSLDDIKCTIKDIQLKDRTEKALILSCDIPEDCSIIRTGVKALQVNAKLDAFKVNDAGLKYMPSSIVLSDYTPANADAIKNILMFAGRSKQEAEDIVALYQRMDMYSASFNYSVLGDVAFARNFYPLRANDMLKTKEQLLMHNLSKLSECTYDTNLIKLGVFKLEQFMDSDPDYDSLKRALANYEYVICKDTKDGIKEVPFSRYVYNNPKDYSAVPADFYQDAIVRTHSLRKQEKFDTHANLAYASSWVSDTLNAASNMRKQMWLFTHVSTWINNLVGGTSMYLSDAGVKGLLGLLTIRPEQQTYKGLYEQLNSLYSNIDDAAITDFFAKTDAAKHMAEDRFRQHYLVALGSGSLSDATFVKLLEAQPDKLVKEAVEKYSLDLDELGFAAFKDYVKNASADMNKIYNKHYDRVTNMYDWMPIQKSLNAYFDADSSVWAQYTKGVSMQYLAERTNMADLTRIPGFGKWFKFNQNMFSTVENFLRDAAAMHYIDKGYSVSDAVQQMLRTQFDYSDVGHTVKALNVVAPFSTYKLMNIKYWLGASDTHAGALRFMSNVGQYMGIVDNMELAKAMYWQNYDYPAEDEDTSETANAIINILTKLSEGYASSKLYQSKHGKVILPDNHYLKNTNPPMEALELFVDAALALTDYAAFKTLLEDQVYSPIVTTSKFLSALVENKVDQQYYIDNYYELNDMVPIFGVIANSIIGNVKAGNINGVTPAMFKALFAFGKAPAEDVMTAVSGIFATLAPTLVGTTKAQKPIGYNWNDQSDEYKATHRFIFGVSALPTALTKDPTKYVDHMGMLIEMGFGKDEAIALLSKGWYFDADGKTHQYNMYGDKDMPNVFKYNADVFDNTLRYLLGRGYNIDAAYTYMKSFGKWVDDAGNVKSLDDVDLLYKQSAEATQYYKLPSYIRNIPNQYSEQLNYYKEQGYTTEQARFLMYQYPLYLENGKPIQLTQEQLSQLNLIYKYNARYKKEAVAKQTVNNPQPKTSPNLNKVMQYSAPERMRTEGGRANQASSNPARYRHPKKIQHSFTYKDIYGLNNIANSKMRSIMAHTHYRSANRYRAVMIRDQFRYQ